MFLNFFDFQDIIDITASYALSYVPGDGFIYDLFNGLVGDILESLLFGNGLGGLFGSFGDLGGLLG